MRRVLSACVFLSGLSASATPVPAAPPDAELAKAVRALDSNVLAPEGNTDARRRAQRMLVDDQRGRRLDANRLDREEWKAIRTREDWEKFRDAHIDALRRSLGRFPPEKTDLKLRSLKTTAGEGYRVENVVFESRPGLVVTANLYLPAEPKESMPGILICHSHHRPKIDGELQDMGMNFARAGCVVLVWDQLGHGERRAHPFATEKDFDGPFRPSRQDYYFRFNTGMQLHLIGESLVGWMAWDMIRGVDVLLSRPGVDKGRIILMGSVAGGGDPSAVAAALDSRINCAVPFNFGGPQPENTYPLPEDSDLTFNVFGGGSWESTRNLRRSIGDGFPPWVIVGSVAPRRLIYAHEFSWDREHDPIWKRLQMIFGWCGKPDDLAFVHGYGRVSLPATEASHCNHIGPPHRKMMYPTLERWFGIPAPKEEYRKRLDAAELLCLDSPGGKDVLMPKLHALARAVADERGEEFRRGVVTMRDATTAERLRDTWKRKLGDIGPAKEPAVVTRSADEKSGVPAERIVLRTEREIDVPVLLLRPRKSSAKPPVVVCVAQAGKGAFLRHRAERLAELLAAGSAVCLVDVRGTGETSLGNDRRWRSDATGVSSTELMHGGTTVGQQLKDLRTVLVHLRSRGDVDPKRIALWGDSFAPVNGPDVKTDVPMDAEKPPAICEPLGHMLALLGGLFEPDVAAVVSARGGLVGWASALDSQFPCVPHDAIVPGCLEAGDLDDVSAAVLPIPMWFGGLVDGRNRPVESPGQEGQRSLLPRTTTKSLSSGRNLVTIRPDAEPGADLTAWVIERLK